MPSYYQYCLPFQLPLRPVVFFDSNQILWQRSQDSIPGNGRPAVFCDRCGLNFLPKQSVCTRCRRVPTRYWFQLMSLVTLLVAVAGNGLVAIFLLPRYAMNNHLPIVTPQLYVNQHRVCDEDTDLGLDYAVAVLSKSGSR